jgi:hypothetical protein
MGVMGLCHFKSFSYTGLAVAAVLTWGEGG